jgi:hypothetical protein
MAIRSFVNKILGFELASGHRLFARETPVRCFKKAAVPQE